MKVLSRRMLLRSGAGVVVALPFLDAMRPARAFAQGALPSRFVVSYMGTCTGGPALTNPAAVGPFTAPLPLSFSGLEPVKQYVTLISKLSLPQYNPSVAPATAPGSALQQQHGGTMSPILSGVTAQDGVAPMVRGTSSDQVAADFLGRGSKYASLQLRVQAASYNNKTGAAAQTRGMSTRKSGTVISELLPIESPLRIFSMLFTGSAPSADAGVVSPTDAGTAAVPSLLARRKSVLDAVLDDATRLSATVGREDKQRLDQHFTHIRELEQSLGPTGGGGADAGVVIPPLTGVCGALASPGPDPAISSYNFGGWANETLRGQQMADMIAYALACDLTRSVSWMFTHDQTWLNSVPLSGSTFTSPDGFTEIHSDSHNATPEIRAKNANWAATLFGRLVNNLQQRREGSGTVLDRTFLSLCFAEGMNAHNKQDFTFVAAGYGSKIQNGVHLNSNGGHPAQIQVAGLQAIGMSTNQLGEVAGVIPGLRL